MHKEASTIGEWIRDKRKEKGLSQKALADLDSTGVIKQSTISSYEGNKVKDVTIFKIVRIGRLLGINPRDLPWELIELDSLQDDNDRIGMYELPKEANTVKLFNGKIYQIEGFLGREMESGDVKNISEIYYHVRSAAKDGKLCAKRKQPNDELTRTCN